MGKRLGIVAVLAAGLLACSDKTVPIEIKVVKQACKGPDPMEGVTHFRFRVTGENLTQPLETVADVGGRSSQEIPNIPAGKKRQIEIAAFAGAPPGGTVVSLGRTTPFDIPEQKNPEAPPLKATVFLRRVNAFTPTCNADTPGDATRMTTPRAGHTATVLADGKVLIAGGFKGLNEAPSEWTMTETAEIYDPATGAFTQTPPMTNSGASTKRAFHTATRLASGQVYVAGGEYVDNKKQLVMTNAILYDADKNVWLPSPKGGMNAPVPGNGRSRQCSAYDTDGANRHAVPSVGGVTMEPATGRIFQNDLIEWYDATADKSWATPAPSKLARSGHQCVPLAFSNGSYLAVVGGRFEDPCPTGTKCMNGTPCTAPAQCTGNYLCPPYGKCINGSPCAPGSQCSDAYSCSQRCPNDGSSCTAQTSCPNFASTVAFVTWRPQDTPPAYKTVAGGADIQVTPQRADAACARIYADTRFICCGGEDPKGNLLPDCLLVKVESPTTSRQAPPLSQERSRACAVTLPDNRVVIIGGRTKSGSANKSSDKAELYASDDKLNTVASNVGPSNDARMYQACTLLADGTVLVLGGVKQDTSQFLTLDTAEVFVPAPVEAQ